MCVSVKYKHVRGIYEDLLTGHTAEELSSRWILPHDDNSWLVF